MKVLLVGGHQKAHFLTKSLKAKGHEITVINEDYALCKMLTDAYEVVSLAGDGTKPYILEAAGASRMDIVIALNDNDSENLVLCEIAAKQFHAKNTFSVVSDPKNIRFFKELGVNRCISSTQMLTELIEQEAIKGDLINYLTIENSSAVVHQIELSNDSPVLNKKLWEIGLPKDSIVCCIIRTEQTIIPQGNTEFKAGDRVILLTYSTVLDRIDMLFSGVKSGSPLFA